MTATDATDATAQTIIALVAHLPERTRRQLRQMLANSIAAPTPSELRESRLGLLIEVVASGGDVSSDRYETLRAAKAALGEQWPSRSQLSRAYGTWLQALDAATTLAGETGAGAPSERQRSRTSHRYTRSDLLLAIERCRLSSGGTWPSPSTYRQWRRLAMRTARDHGRSEPSIPSISAITKRFGTWTRAIELAAAAATDRHAARDALI